MAKRFEDTDKYKKSFIRNMPGPYKLLWDYICLDCDHAGVWQVDFEVAQIYLGRDMAVKPDLALGYFNDKEDRVQVINCGSKWLIKPFIQFQYGWPLNPENRVHRSVLAELAKYGIKDLIRPLEGPKEKDKEKDKEEGGSGGKVCPHAAIVALYHSTLPGLPMVKDWTPARRAFLKSRWDESPERQSLEWWESFFKTYVLASPFLMGRVVPRNGDKPFKADLEWLVRPSNFTKVYEGRYLSDTAPQAHPRPVVPPSNAYKPIDYAEKAAYERSEAWHKAYYKSGSCPACGYTIKGDLDVCNCETYKKELDKAVKA